MKKTTIILTYLLFLLSPILAFPQCGSLVWSDEFNGTTVDATKWNVNTGNGCPSLCGWGTGEVESYANSTNNVSVAGGFLTLEARNAGGTYTSGRLNSSGKFNFKYGRLEMRAKLPVGTGLWPAFWMLPDMASPSWPNTGEIDIMENRGDQPYSISSTLHYGNPSPGQYDGSTNTLTAAQGKFSDNFHTFAVDWKAGQIDFYVDGVIFKSETKTPQTLVGCCSGTPWPWDNNPFYIIMNLAVGGTGTAFTGSQATNFGLSAQFIIDYVRVYSSAQPQLIIAGKAEVFANSIATYTITSGAGQAYNWAVPAGATITGGQGTTQITVNWGNSAGGDISVTVADGAGSLCPGSNFVYTRSVKVYKNSCNFVFMDYETTGIANTMTPGYVAGGLSTVANPNIANAVNNSGLSAKYVRSTTAYDALFYENALLDNGPDYASATPTYVLKMDLYSNAPIGTTVQIQLGNEAIWGSYPTGVHSYYTATTTLTGQWETLKFTYASSPDPGGAAYQYNLDRFVILFNPGLTNSYTYYIDNIRRDLVTPAPTLTITGSAAVPSSAIGIPYSVLGYSNAADNFTWGVPTGASVASGAGTTAISVNFGLLGGYITVQEKMPSGCYGPLAKQAVSVGTNSCAIFADEFDDGKTAPWLANSSGAGFTHTEIISDWRLTSLGSGEWDYVDYTLNDGVSPITLDFTNPVNVPLLKFRARVAAGNAYITITMVDYLGRAANNQYLNPLNGFELTTTSQEFTIDFTGQLWDQYGGGGALDISKITKLRIAYNPGFASFPHVGTYKTYSTAFIGTSFMDYIRIGSVCPTPTANFTATDLVLCGTGAGYTTTYIDNSISAVAGTTYSWNFGAGATPATASAAGPYPVYYSTPGWKTTTLTLNSGVSTRTKTSYVYVSPISTNCMYYDNFTNNAALPFIAAQGNFTFTETASNWNVSTTGHGEWETFTLAFNDGTVITPIDFSCANTAPTITLKAKATSAVSLRLGISDQAGITTANTGVTSKSLELTTTYQIFTVNLKGLFSDIYTAGGPYAVDSTDAQKIQFRVNPGFASSPWTGPIHGAYNTTFAGTINMDYIGMGTNCASSLPMQLVSFDASLGKGGVALNWITATELNLNHFEVQRIENGRAITIATVKAGNTNTISTYAYTDRQPLSGGNYYRIAAVDNDGTEQYSEIIFVQTNQETFNIVLYPNPSSEGFTLQLPVSAVMDFAVKIFSSEGTLVEEKKIEKGEDSAIIGNKLNAGIYFVQVSSSTETKIIKAVKY